MAEWRQLAAVAALVRFAEDPQWLAVEFTDGTPAATYVTPARCHSGVMGGGGRQGREAEGPRGAGEGHEEGWPGEVCLLMLLESLLAFLLPTCLLGSLR